jgi:hypothetical protein
MTVIDTRVDIDNTTSGLNFATKRPRTAILRDQARVLRTVYDPANYYDRLLRTALQLGPNLRHRTRLVERLKMVWGFLRLSAKAGFNLRTGPLYWQTLFTVLATNPKAVQAAASMAALYLHFGEQSKFVVDLLERKVAEIERRGEEDYNAQMIAGAAPDRGRRADGQPGLGVGRPHVQAV